MPLQREVSLCVGVQRVPPIQGLLAVHFNANVVTLGNHFLREPLVRLMRGRVHHRNFFLILAEPSGGVKATGADGVTVRGVNLRLVPLRELRSERRAESISFLTERAPLRCIIRIPQQSALTIRQSGSRSGGWTAMRLVAPILFAL